jgi:hypothetical protein
LGVEARDPDGDGGPGDAELPGDGGRSEALGGGRDDAGVLDGSGRGGTGVGQHRDGLALLGGQFSECDLGKHRCTSLQATSILRQVTCRMHQMESKFLHRTVHVCSCPDCQQGLRSEIVEEHRAINHLIATLDEKWRPLFAGFWATVYGRGGIERLTVITGLSRTTIRRGKREFQQPVTTDTSRIRKLGGGRKRIEKTILTSGRR